MTNTEKLQEIFKWLEGISYIKSDSIPDIDLYMDQVTRFMNERLQKMKRYPEDKVLTKTMINNYAKNHLLPAPDRKKYSKEHMLLLIFIYYFKNLLSFHDLEQLLNPITESCFSSEGTLSLKDLYEEIFSLEEEEMNRLKQDVQIKFQRASSTFEQVEEEEEREYLQLFAFICELCFDVYLKKQMIEMMIDQLRQQYPIKKKK